MDPKPDDRAYIRDLAVACEQLVQRLQHANQGDLRCRELSTAITNIEQGGHWLAALLQRLKSEAQ